MKDWRFRYYSNRNELFVHRRSKPFPSIGFHPYSMSDWLWARGDHRLASQRWLPADMRSRPAPFRPVKGAAA